MLVRYVRKERFKKRFLLFIIFKSGNQLIMVRKIRLTIIDILSTKGGLVMMVRKVRMVRLTIKYRFSQKGTPSNDDKICKKGKIYFYS